MLLKDTLKILIQELIDQEYVNFKGFPKTIEEASDNWAKVFSSYIGDLAVPHPGSSLTQLSILEKAFSSELLVQLQAQGVTPVDLQIPITNLILGVSLNITSLGVFTSTPPPTILDITSCFLTSPKFEGTSETVAENLSLTIDTWVKTAIAINNVTGVQVNWA